MRWSLTGLTFLVGAALFAAEERPAAAVPDDWAFHPAQRPAVPAVKTADRARNPIDAFVLARLQKEGRTFAPAADPLTLLRRVTFDLTGLPPTPEEIDAFLADRSPDAYAKAVDRLLASPAYGERMAMGWLDLVRYAETDGFKADDHRPDAWRYRDYVIRSFNSDKRYDRFVTEQLAGEELAPDDADARIATGFLRHFPDEYNAVNLEQRRQEILNDITDTVGVAFLGLTVGCAKCHDHKFDPITQEDYYRLQAFFAAYRPTDSPALPPAARAEHERRMAAWEKETAEMRRRMEELEGPARKQFEAKRKVRFPQEYQDILAVPPEERTPLQKQLAAMAEKQVTAGPTEVAKAMKPAVKDEWQKLKERMAALDRDRPPQPPTAMGMTDVGPVAPPTYLLKRGDWRSHGQEVRPGFLSAIDDREAELQPPTGPTTGRRLALAKWLTRPDNPLTARVMVNRLWQHHFGRGLAATPGDLGAQGERPTHPELLDWLATEFVARGWSLKQMHRLMVLSETYRQSSGQATRGREPPEADPENRLFGRMNRQRLEGEALRDAMLSVCGELNRKIGGPSVYPEMPAELKAKDWPVSADAAERSRRSVYVFAKRNMRYPLFSLFDAPDGNEACARRYVTTGAPQALTLLNDRLILDHARRFAARVLRDCGSTSNTSALIDRAFLLALGRTPDAEEQRTAREFLQRQTALLRGRGVTAGPLPTDDPAAGAALVDFCHGLLNVNEFLFID
jgi:hypothetical protein